MPDDFKLKFLYFFSAASQDLLEVRIQGLPEGTSPGRVYHWLYNDRAAQKLQKLTFQSMSSDKGEDLRMFAEAELRFDRSQAQFRWSSQDRAEASVLDVCSVASIPPELVSRVQCYLRSLPT